MELVNENSILESWICDRLRGEQTQPGGTWTDIPPLYAAELDRRWNAHLKQRYPDRDALSAAWKGDLKEDEDPGTRQRAPPARRRFRLRFP